MLAAASGSAATLQAVMDAGGADLEAKDVNGYTAFLWACDRGHTEVVAVLTDAGCDTAVKSKLTVAGRG